MIRASLNLLFPPAKPQALRIVALVKGEERYVFLFHDSEPSRSQAFRTLGRFACDPDLSFSWYDAAVVSQRIRQEDGV